MFFASIGAKAQGHGAEIDGRPFPTIGDALDYIQNNYSHRDVVINVTGDHEMSKFSRVDRGNRVTINGQNHSVTTTDYNRIYTGSTLIVKDLNLKYTGTKYAAFTIDYISNGGGNLYIYSGTYHSQNADVINCSERNGRIYIYGGEFKADNQKCCAWVQYRDNLKVFRGKFISSYNYGGGLAVDQAQSFPVEYLIPEGYAFYDNGKITTSPLGKKYTSTIEVRPCEEPDESCPYPSYLHKHEARAYLEGVTLTGEKINNSICSIDGAVSIINEKGGDYTLKLEVDNTYPVDELIIKNPNANVLLDLNGKNLVTRNGKRSITVEKGALTITSSQVSTSTVGKYGIAQNVFAGSEGKLKILRGTFLAHENDYGKYADEACALYSITSLGYTYVTFDDKYAAKIGTTKYETLQAAFDAASKGQRIFLLKDINETASLTTYKNIALASNTETPRTINGSGSTPSIVLGGKCFFQLENVALTAPNSISLQDGARLLMYDNAYIQKVSINSPDAELTTNSSVTCMAIDNSGNGQFDLRGGTFGEDVNKYLKDNYVATYNPSGDRLYHVTNKTPDGEDITVSLKKSDGSITGYADLGDAVRAANGDATPTFTILRRSYNDNVTIPSGTNAVLNRRSSTADNPCIELAGTLEINGSLYIDGVNFTLKYEKVLLTEVGQILLNGKELSIKNSQINETSAHYSIEIRQGKLTIGDGCDITSIKSDDGTTINVTGGYLGSLKHKSNCSITFTGGEWGFDPANHCDEPSHMGKGKVSKKISDNPVKYTVGTDADACFEVVETKDKYSTLEAAIKSLSVKTATINMLKSYTTTGSPKIPAGYNVTLTRASNQILTLHDKLNVEGTLNIKNTEVACEVAQASLYITKDGVLNTSESVISEIYNYSNGKVNLNGGVISKLFSTDNGNILINGGSVEEYYAHKSSIITIKDCSKFIIENTTNADNVRINIEGGNGIQVLTNKSKEIFNITGGTFITNNPAQYLEPTYYAEPVSGESNKWTVKAGYVAQVGDVKYHTLAEALNAVNSNEETTIKILDNYTMGVAETVAISKDIKFEGVNINISLTINDKLSVENGGKLTLKTVNIKSDNTNTLLLKNGSTLTVDDNNVVIDKVATVGKPGESTTDKVTVNISNGNIYDYTFVDGHDYNITGGTFKKDVNDLLKGNYVADHDGKTGGMYIVSNKTNNNEDYKVSLWKGNGDRRGYTTLTDAMADAAGSNVLILKLLADCEEGNKQISIPSDINATIAGGTHTMTLAHPIQVAGTLTVTDGTVALANGFTGDNIFTVNDYTTNSSTVDASNAVLSINGTTFPTGDGSKTSVNISKGKLVVYGGKFKDIKVIGTTDETKKPVVNISGGEIAELNITGKPKVDIYGGVLDLLKHDNTIVFGTDYINIEGGYFKFDPKSETETIDGTHNHTQDGAKKIGEGLPHAGYYEVKADGSNNNFGVVLNGSQTPTWYRTFESAIGYANSANTAIITLATDKTDFATTDYTTINSGSNITIDANGKTFTLTNAINVAGNLTVKNGTFAGTAATSGIGVRNGGTLTIDNGGESQAVTVANVNVQGGTLQMKSGTCTNLTASGTESKCYIVGGTTDIINSSNGANIYIANGTVNNLYARANSETSISSNPVVTIKEVEGNNYGKINISGGNSITLPTGDKTVIETIKSQFNISGGKFVSVNPNPYLTPKYYGVVEDSGWRVGGDYKIQIGDNKFHDLAAAFTYVNADSQQADEMLIHEDITSSVDLTLQNKRNITINGQGHKINFSGAMTFEGDSNSPANSLLYLKDVHTTGNSITVQGKLHVEENAEIDNMAVTSGEAYINNGIVHAFTTANPDNMIITGGAFNDDVTDYLKGNYVVEYAPGTEGFDNLYHVKGGFNLFLKKPNHTIKGYTSLTTAIANADDGSVITLLDKCIEANGVTIDKEVGINVKSGNGNQDNGFVSVAKPVVVTANVTMTDVQLESGAGFSGSEMVNINNNSTLTLNGKSSLPNSNGAAIANAPTSVKISSGRLNVQGEAICPTIDMDNQTTLYVDGGKVYDLKHGDNCFIQISDGHWHFNPELHANCHGDSHAAEGVIVSAPDANGWYTTATDGIFAVTYGEKTTKHNSFEGAIWAIPFNYTEAAINVLGDYTTTQSVTIPLNYTLTLTGTEGKTLTLGNNADLNINGGLIVNSGTIANGWVNIDGGKLQITGGSIANLAGSNNATLDISGGTVQNLSADNTAMTLNGGTVSTLSGTHDANLVLNSGVCGNVTTDGDAIFTMDINSTAGVGNFTFGNRANVTIKGGKFKVDPNEYTDQSYFAPYDSQAEYHYTVESGYVSKAIIDGTVYKFHSLAEAIEALNDARVNTATLILEIDYEVQGTDELIVPSGKDITILGRDIYGKTYDERLEHKVTLKSPVKVLGKLTIRDGIYQIGSTFSNGGNNKYFYVANGGRLVIKRGTIDANVNKAFEDGEEGSRAASASYANAITVENGGALEIYGGTFRGTSAADSDCYGLFINGNDVDIQLSGGTFSGNDYTSEIGGAMAWGPTSLTMDELLFPGSMMYRTYDMYNIFTTTKKYIDGSITVSNAVIPEKNFNTMIAPDDLTFVNSQVRAFIPMLTTDSGNNAIMLTETLAVKKGTPLVIYCPLSGGHSIPVCDGSVEPSEGNLLTGTMYDTQVASSQTKDIFILSEISGEPKFVHITNSPASIARGRAYITLPSDVAKNGITFLLPDGIDINLNPVNPDITGITNVTTGDDVNAPTYNLAGQRIDSTTRHRGIIIRNGRKVAVK